MALKMAAQKNSEFHACTPPLTPPHPNQGPFSPCGFEIKEISREGVSKPGWQINLQVAWPPGLPSETVVESRDLFSNLEWIFTIYQEANVNIA